jgi:hypothetical protein
VIDAQGFYPALLAQSETNKKTQLHQFRNREMLIELLPQSIVGDIGIPGDRAGIGQRNLFALAEPVRFGKVQELIIFFFGEALPSSLDGALNASILALDRL